MLSQLEVRAGRHGVACALIQESLEAAGASREAAAAELVFGALAGTRERSAAIKALDVLRAGAGLGAQSQVMRRRMIIWYSMLEAYDGAYEVMHGSLDDFAATGTIGAAWAFLWLPELAGFRADSRFTTLVARMRMPDYWARYGPPDGYEWRDNRLVAR